MCRAAAGSNGEDFSIQQTHDLTNLKVTVCSVWRMSVRVKPLEGQSFKIVDYSQSSVRIN